MEAKEFYNRLPASWRFWDTNSIAQFKFKDLRTYMAAGINLRIARSERQSF
jgi:hypothetical protein